MSYEDHWHFWLDDACYRVARGVRYLDLPSEVSPETWAKIEASKSRLEQHHGVVIRGVSFGDCYEVQVAQHEWVFRLLDWASEYCAVNESTDGGEIVHAVNGILLGYSSEAIDRFLTTTPPRVCGKGVSR